MHTLKLKRLTGNQKGLTLIELLAVIIVLGIILAIAVPSVLGVVNRSKINADKATWLLLQEAGLQYAIANNLDQDGEVSVNELVTLGYLNSEPKKQSNAFSGNWGYVKIFVSNGGQYTVKVYTSGNTEITESMFGSGSSSSSGSGTGT